MAEQTIEGTWEEIARQAERLSGKRVRLSILTDGSPEAALDAPVHETTSPEEWSRALREWAASHPRIEPGLSDEAISRESLYGKRLEILSL